jgi:hypothetical protein
MKPTYTPQSNTATNAPSWRQRIEDALSALKTAPPETGFTRDGDARTVQTVGA